jgi:hypothetical protein
MNSQGRLIIAGTADISFTNALFFYELTNTFDSIHARFMMDQPGDWIWDILDQSALTGYDIFVSGFSSVTNSPGQVIEVDSLFNFINFDSIPKDLYFYHTAMRRDDTSYYVTGAYHPGFTDIRDIGILCLNSNNDPLLFNSIGKPPDTIDYPGYYQNMDFYHSCDTIYVGGTSNQKIAPYFINADFWFILSNLDSNLQIRWTKFYGGGCIL